MNEIEFFVQQNISWILERLKSKDDIRKDWINIFKKTARKGYDCASELDIGTERVLYDLFGQYRPFSVNSCPIGSDLMFETPDAYIHIEVKTATEGNNADFGGKIQIAQNQTSYSVDKKNDGEPYPFKASLPKIYSNGKVCLTYVIQTIHNNNEDKPKIMSLFSIPNGALFETYKNCVNSGKHTSNLNRLDSKGDIRFIYRIANRFENLNEKPSRIKILYPVKKTYSSKFLKKFLGVKKLD